MNDEERAELAQLDAAERAGLVLTGGERGRLADLRMAKILATVAGLLPLVNPVTAGTEVR
jgi:predicted alpha/beta-hydrolase family hydrolase